MSSTIEESQTLTGKTISGASTILNWTDSGFTSNFVTAPVGVATGTTTGNILYLNMEPKSKESKATSRRNIRRRALIVGINEYENPANWLNGCVPDAMDMAETLKILKFPPSNIKLLLNEKASTAGIKKGLDWLVKDAREGDVLIFSYSGHGSQVADLDNDEQDRLDEIICPWDISWNDEKYITDDVLYDYFTNKVPAGVRIDVILDSCFSGTATRSISAANNSWASKNLARRQRFLPPPRDHVFRINSMVPQFTDVKRFGKSVTRAEENKKTQHNCLLTGSAENQVSEEVEFESGIIRGVLTYYFSKILRRSNGNITRGEAYSILRSSIANDGFSQTPNLEVPSAEALDLFFFRKESEVDRVSDMKK